MRKQKLNRAKLQSVLLTVLLVCVSLNGVFSQEAAKRNLDLKTIQVAMPSDSSQQLNVECADCSLSTNRSVLQRKLAQSALEGASQRISEKYSAIIPDRDLAKPEKGKPAGITLFGPQAGRLQIPSSLVPKGSFKNRDDAKLKNKKAVTRQQVSSSQVWQTIFSEDFEGSFPSGNSWDIRYDQAAPYFWDDANAQARSGNWSGWCADGTVSPNPSFDPNSDNYVNNMNSWMIYGPFDLSDATDAKLDFWYWLDSEANYDYFWWVASTNRDSAYYGFNISGNSNGYQFQSFDLKNVPTLGNLTGQPEVYIALLFQTDASVTARGVFLDDVVLQKFTGAGQAELVANRMYLRTGINSGNEVNNPVAGQQYYIHFDWQNTGTAATDTFRWEIRLNGALRCSQDLSTAANTSWASWCTGPWTATAGTHTFTANLDVLNAVSEPNENNNSVSRTWTISQQQPDLVADQVYLRTGPNSGVVVETPVAGQQYYVHLDWRNTGSAAANFRLEMKFNGSVVCSGNVSANATSTSTTWCASPLTWSTGSNTVEGTLDVNNIIVEADENNNTDSRTYPECTDIDGALTGTGIALDGSNTTLDTYRFACGYFLINTTETMYPGGLLPSLNNPSGVVATHSAPIDSNNTPNANNLVFDPNGDNNFNDNNDLRASVSAHDHTEAVYDYFLNSHNRNSWNGLGTSLVSIVHGIPDTSNTLPNNAFWNGVHMTYGDGDSMDFSNFAAALDVVAHEITHGVTQSSVPGGLIYQNQSGALNESYSDVFAATIDNSNWTIAETNTLQSPFFLRSLADPHQGFPQHNFPWGRAAQPAHMNEFIPNGGVHINSGIPNRAAYLIASNIGRDKTARIYYRTLTTYLTSNAQFIDAANSTIQAAVDLYGDNSAEEQAVENAFIAVGILPDSSGAADIALVLDRSGSMSGQKIIDARNAASTFVDFMEDGDQVAVASFSNTASLDFPLTRIVSAATRTAAQTAIGRISAGGSTTIGGGMQAGQAELDRGDPSHAHAMLLLSDGDENTAPLVSQVLPTIPAETDIYTIGLGAGANQALMSQIATQTDGLYYFAPTSQELFEIYLRIRGIIEGLQTIASFQGQIGQSQQQLWPLFIDQLTSEAIFSFVNQNGDLDLELISPSGVVIDPQAAATDPNVTHTESSNSENYRVLTPEAGQWQMKVIGANVGGSEPYTAICQGNSDLVMTTFFDKSSYNAGEAILISAQIEANGQPITGATVTADVTVPSSSTSAYQQSVAAAIGDPDVFSSTHFDNSLSVSGVPESVTYVTTTTTLFDDGQHNDGAANDGVYANHFTNTVNDGSYIFTVKASGTSQVSGTFQRESFITTVVNPSTAPTIVSLSPGTGQQGETLDVTITGANFEAGTTVSFSGSGISVNSVTFNSTTELIANITIDPNTTAGPRDVTVMNPSGQQGIGPGLFTVLDCQGTASFFDDFEDGTADGWVENSPSLWAVQPEGNNMNYCVIQPHPSGDESSLLPTLRRDFTMEVDARADGGVSFFTVFGVQSFTNSTDTSYYLRFTRGGVDLFRTLVAGQGVIIASSPNDYISDGQFHRVKIERAFPNIEVTVDGQYLFDVDDQTFSEGYVGVGARKTLACFDNVSIVDTGCPLVAATSVDIPDGLTIPAGATLAVPVVVSTSDTIGLAQFTIDYDGNDFQFNSASVGSGAPGFTVSQVQTNPPFSPPTSGTNKNVIVQISGGGTNSFTGNDKEVVLLSFDAVGAVGATSPLGLDPDCSHTYLTTLSFNDLCGSQVSFENGDATIVAASDVDGFVDYYRDSRPVSGARLDLTGASQRNATTDATGHFVISNVALGSHTLTPSMTNNHLGAIKGSDVLLVMRFLAFLQTLTTDQLICADVTKDGTVSGSDVVAMLRFLAFFSSNIAGTGEWKFSPPSASLDISASVRQDFKAYLLGDVSGDWGSTTTQLAKGESMPGTLRLDRVASSASEARVPISVDALTEPLHTFAFSVQYDTSYVAFAALERLSATSAFEAVVNVAKPGQVHVAAVGLEPVWNASAVFDLVFRVEQRQSSGGADFVPLVITRAELNDRGAASIDGSIELRSLLSLEIPETFEIRQNYPNPFNLGTTITFGVPKTDQEASNILLEIFNVKGQVIRRLLDEAKQPGFHSLHWDGRDETGSIVSTGIYFYTLKTERTALSRKLLLLK